MKNDKHLRRVSKRQRKLLDALELLAAASPRLAIEVINIIIGGLYDRRSAIQKKIN